MIQRIQTLYLVVSLICTGIFYFAPFGHLVGTDLKEIPVSISSSNFTANDKVIEYSLLPMVIMFSIINLTTLVTIFMFKKRMLQIRFTIFNVIMQIGSFGMLFYYLTDISKKIGLDYTTGIMIIFPLIASILSFLAMRAIAKDEALVRSVSRLRKK